MPFSSGTYSAPASSFNPAVASTTIDPTAWNSLLTDLSTALSTTLLKDGTQTTTASIPFANGLTTDTVGEVSSGVGVTVDGAVLKDFNITLSDSGDNTKKATFAMSTIGTGTTRTFTFPNASGTFALSGAGLDLAVGATTISGGTNGRILFDNSSVLGEKAVTGTGDVVLATSPTLVTPALGTPASGTLTNCTGLPLSGLASQNANTFVANGTGSSAAPTAIALAASQLAGRGSAGNITAITLGTGLSMSSDTLNVSAGMTLGTSQATTSGGTKTFTGISAKQLTLSWAGGSTNGTAAILVQIGSGSLTTSGYVGSVITWSTSGGVIPTHAAFSSGFTVLTAQNAAGTYGGFITLTLIDASTNTWAATFQFGSQLTSSTNTMFQGAGYVSLAGTLDRIALVVTDTFDAGVVNVAYI